MNWCFNICFVTFVFLGLMGLVSFLSGIYFCLFSVCYFIEWEVIVLNSGAFVMTVLFDWMSLMFMEFVLFFSAMVTYYSDNYMEGDVNLVRFILLVILFVVYDVVDY